MLITCLYILVFFLLGWFVIPILIRKRQTWKLAKLCAQNRAIALTFDDGPSSDLSARLAALLDSRKVPATFFLIGREMEQQQDLSLRLYQAGHEIGSHTYDHHNAWKKNPYAVWLDLRSGFQSLSNVGIPVVWFRPPFGKITLASWLQIRFSGLKLAFWTVDSRDSWDRKKIPNVLDELNRQGGGVILMHDFNKPSRGPFPELHADYVLELTEAIIDFAHENRFQLVRFSEIFNRT